MPTKFTKRSLIRGYALIGLALLAASPVCAAPAPPSAPPAAVHVGGAVLRPSDWTTTRLATDLASDVRTVRYTLKGQTHTARAVPLLAVVQAAGPRLNPHIKNHALQFVLSVQGRDGYTVDFSLAELLPDFGHAAVWVALDRDGKPLTADDAPVSLLVPGDVKAGRWVHAVTVVSVVDGAAPTPPAGRA